MSYAKNEFGVPQFPTDDARRLLVLLAAIDLLERPTVSAVADLTGQEREAVDAGVQALREQYGVLLHKVGEIYHIQSWGELLQADGVKRLLKQ